MDYSCPIACRRIWPKQEQPRNEANQETTDCDETLQHLVTPKLVSIVIR